CSSGGCDLVAWPEDPLPVQVEMWTGEWVDITNYVYARGGGSIAFSRGMPDEGNGPDPGLCTFQLNNRDGRFSPRNPMSPYYGLIGRNTPVRVSVNLGEVAEVDRIRWVGEISEWPVRWDVSGQDVWVDVRAQGILRRLY